jgi:hypothetical protein
LRGSSNNFCQNSDEKGKDSSPTKVPIKYSAVSGENSLPLRGVDGTDPIREKRLFSFGDGVQISIAMIWWKIQSNGIV